MTKISAILWAFVLALFTTDVLGQTPSPEPGIWTGTVVIKKTYLYLNHVKTSTFTVSGYVGTVAVGADYFYGIITNLDNRDNIDNSDRPHEISVPLLGLEENTQSNVYLGSMVFEVPILLKSLRFTKNATTQKMRSVTFKQRITGSIGFDGDVISEATVTLTWRKLLPSVP